MPRCFDCFAEFAPNQERFAVLKQMREWPPCIDKAEARALNSLLYDAVYVCGDCAGWYGDDATEVTAAEAGHA